MHDMLSIVFWLAKSVLSETDIPAVFSSAPPALRLPKFRCGRLSMTSDFHVFTEREQRGFKNATSGAKGSQRRPLVQVFTASCMRYPKVATRSRLSLKA